MGRIRDYPSVQVRHLHDQRTRLGGLESEFTVSLTPITVRRPAHGVKRAAVACSACGAELDVRIHSATNTRVTKMLLLLLGIVASATAVVLFPIMTATDAGWAIAGAFVSLFLACGGFVGFHFVDGVRLRKGGVVHRLY